MKKGKTKVDGDELRPEYDLSKLVALYRADVKRQQRLDSEPGLVIALAWTLIGEVCIACAAVAVGAVVYSGPKDGWFFLTMFMWAVAAAALGLPILLGVMVWHWRTSSRKRSAHANATLECR